MNTEQIINLIEDAKSKVYTQVTFRGETFFATKELLEVIFDGKATIDSSTNKVIFSQKHNDDPLILNYAVKTIDITENADGTLHVEIDSTIDSVDGNQQKA